MDTSANDPQRFRIRRSPSIGSSASPVTSAVRSGKRKLSTAAFGSSPSMGPHPPSSPITSDPPTDSMHNVSQVASTSRTTIDTIDAGLPAAASDKATSNVHPNASNHTQFTDWQEQRRCHSILADFDYSASAIEDRRDPRSSKARIVMPVASSQSQVMSAGAARDLHPSGTASQHASLQHSPMASCESQHTELEAQASPLTISPVSRAQQTEQATGPRSAQLQSSLSQASLSMPPSPDRGVSASPSFSAFNYGAQPASVSQRRPSSAQSSSLNNHDGSLLRTSQEASSGLCAGPRQDDALHAQDAAVASSTAGSAAACSRPSSRTSSLQDSERSALAASTQEALPSKSGSSQAAFFLQPVPATKRRRIEDASASSGCKDSKHRNLETIDEVRRSSDAGLRFPPRQGEVSVGMSKTSTDPSAIHMPQSSSSRSAGQYASSHTQAVPTASTSATRALTSKRQASPAVSGASSGASTGSSKGSAGVQRTSHFDNVPAFPSMAPPRKQHATLSRRMPRLVRAQSVPNLRAKATLDISAESHHRLVVPSHWASYVASHARQGREGAIVSGRNSNSRSSKGFPFNVAHYSAGSGSSRSRSTFTPTLHPPITRHTLRELDLFEILKNPQLRHDVVFDPNVQFRPNFDGERGRRKREAGERYWTAVVREIETGCTCTTFSHGQLLPCTCKAKKSLRQMNDVGTQEAVKPLQQSRIPSRIPLLVQELRTICLSILPSNYPVDALAADTEDSAAAITAEQLKTADASASERVASSLQQKSTVSTDSSTPWTTTHHQLIAQTLDPHLISQELQHCVLDVPSLVTFMGSILKLHCAPMRDEAIEKMVEVVCVDRNIGKGLRLCFEILELMKLDIANHQLRSARPFLIETAVDFETRWFKEQIEQGKMSLDKTTAWMQQALVSSTTADADTPRNDAVVKAFNQGMVQLIFDVPGSLPLVSPVATPVGSPSSSSLNHTFASHYPETLQFDAYRMMTFHNDVSDLTIVYMLLLLFRQLCGTPLDDGGTLPSSVSSIMQEQLKSIKSEIWCLVNDANLCLSSKSALPPTPVGASGPTPSTSSTDGKLFLGSAGGFAKLDQPRWRRAMQNVLLQVAARAGSVQTAARAGLSDPSTVKAAAPSASTQKLLNSWMDTNLRSGSALHKICQTRLRDVVQGMLGDKVRNGLQPTARSVPCASAVAASSSNVESDRFKQKRAVPSEPQEGKDADLTPTKRFRRDASSGTPSSSSSSSSSEAASTASAVSPWDATMTRAGLDPFAAEIRLLSDRIAKVAIFHLRVFRNLYEGIESGRHKSVGGTQRP
ncbi:Protein SOK1 [Pseudozyma hubeiensis]|nr:Protein SOK1 [Pseudozyma hubeiensis]